MKNQHLLPLIAAATLIGCGESPAERAYELRAECGRDARAVAAEFVADFRRDQQQEVESGLNSHYSSRKQRCYAHIWLTFGSSISRSFLVDVDENRQLGEFNEQLLPKTQVYRCILADKTCATSDEWLALTKPYMEQ